MENQEEITIDRSRYEHKVKSKPKYKSKPGLTKELIYEISRSKNEPDWMLEKRLKSFEYFKEKAIPTWGPDLSKLNLDEIIYYIRPDAKQNATSWEDVPDDIKKTFDKLGIPESEKKYFSGVGAQFECITEDSIVYTNPKGGKKIKHIEPGDKVFALDEENNQIVSTRVKNVQKKGIRPVFEVKVRGKTIKATYNHPFLALVDRRKAGRKRARYNKEWLYLNDLKKDDIIAVATDLPDFGKPYTFKHITYKKLVKGKNQFGAVYDLDISHTYADVSFPKKTNNDLMWLFGFYLGDGYISKSKGKDKLRLNFAVHEKQVEIKNKIKAVIKKYFKYTIITEDKDRMQINSTKIALFFKENGLYGNAKTKNLPSWVNSIPKEQKINLLSGYIDSDGTVTKTSRNIALTSVNKKLLEQIKELCVYCGITTSKIMYFNTYLKKTSKNYGCYRLLATGQIKNIPCVHPTKRKRLLSRPDSKRGKSIALQGTTIKKYCSESVGFARIEDIKYLGKEVVYDIEVENQHNFVANGIIVHNSETVYHNIQKDLTDKGVLFLDMDTALKEHEDLVKEYFMTKCIPINDHKFISLHGAVWSGGTFLYIPKGVKIDLPLQAYFRMNTKAAGQFEHTLIIAEEGSQAHYFEGCFTKGAKIWTNPNYKSIEEVKTGDKVLTHTGRYKKVYHTQKRKYTGDLYNIQIYGNSTVKIEVTEEHPFLYVKREFKREKNKDWAINWGTPKDLKKQHYLVTPINKKIKTQKQKAIKIKKYNNNTKKFSNVTVKIPSTKEFFRLAGYYLAEGSISNKYYLNFSFGSHEKEYIKDVKQLLKKTFKIEKTYEKHHKTNNGTCVTVASVKHCRIFKNFGTSCYTKEIPQWMMLEDLEKQKELIIGLFRGDGNYYKNKTPSKGWLKELFRINTTSEKLANQVRDILLRLGIPAFLNKQNREKTSRKTLYTIGVTGYYLKKFGDLVGIKVKEKINGKKRATMFHIDKDYAYMPIKKITKKKVKNIDVYNFGVENDESYVANSVAVHNCSAPRYTKNSLHAGCVEVYVKKNARFRYSSIESWSKNTYNLNTKRAIVEENGTIEWLGGNIGSGVTMLYPSSILKGKGARAEHISIAYAGDGQTQDTGAKIYHLAPNTTSTVQSKSICKDGGTTNYRGIIKINKGATNAKSSVSCDSLMLDDKSKANTWPTIEVNEDKADVVHEATTGKISEEQLFYLMSRGLNEQDARNLLVSGFVEPVAKELPVEYAVELNKFIQLEIED